MATLAIGVVSVGRADINDLNSFVAQATTLNQSVCGGSNFSTCASVTIEWNYTNQTARVTVTNLGGADAIFTAIGLNNMPAGTNVYVFNAADSYLPPDWSVTSNSRLTNGGAGLTENLFTVDANNPAPQNGLAVGNSLTFLFDFTGTLTQAQMQQVGLAIHAQGGPTGCSTKLNINVSGTVTNTPTTYTGCGASTVPEPATIGLVTTGLLGLGGAGFLRRRKKA